MMKLFTVLVFGWMVPVVFVERVSGWRFERFKLHPTNQRKTCRRGLWRYSLPFFEIGHSFGWFSWSSPLHVLYSGQAYGHAIHRKTVIHFTPDDYRRYQQETSPFFLWFSKAINKTL